MAERRNVSVFFDQLGVLYTYRRPDGSLVPVQDAIRFLYDHIRTLPNYSSLVKGKELSIEKEVRAELLLIKSGKLKVAAIPYSVENIIECQNKGIIPIMMSSNLLETMYIIRDKIVSEYNEGQITSVKPKLLVPDDQCISFTEENGDKNDPADWVRIANKKCTRSNPLIVYEDSRKRLEAAVSGLGVTGFHVVNYNFDSPKKMFVSKFIGSIIESWAIASPKTSQTIEDKIFSGSMQQLLGILKKHNEIFSYTK